MPIPQPAPVPPAVSSEDHFREVMGVSGKLGVVVFARGGLDRSDAVEICRAFVETRLAGMCDGPPTVLLETCSKDEKNASPRGVSALFRDAFQKKIQVVVVEATSTFTPIPAEADAVIGVLNHLGTAVLALNPEKLFPAVKAAETIKP